MIYALKKVRKTLLLGSASAALALVAVSPSAYADEAQAKRDSEGDVGLHGEATSTFFQSRLLS